MGTALPPGGAAVGQLLSISSQQHTAPGSFCSQKPLEYQEEAVPSLGREGGRLPPGSEQQVR